MTGSAARPARPGGRRGLALALAVCVGGSALGLVAAGRVWVRARAEQGSLRVALDLTGGDVAPAVPALALAALAGALAVIATRGAGRRLVGLALAACGAVGAAGALRVVQAPGAGIEARAGDALGTGSAAATGVAASAWPFLAVIAGIAVTVAGLAVLVLGPSWPGMSARYAAPEPGAAGRGPGPVARPGAPAAQPGAGSPLDQWKALDRGEDPTA